MAHKRCCKYVFMTSFWMVTSVWNYKCGLKFWCSYCQPYLCNVYLADSLDCIISWCCYFLSLTDGNWLPKLSQGISQSFEVQVCIWWICFKHISWRECYWLKLLDKKLNLLLAISKGIFLKLLNFSCKLTQKSYLNMYNPWTLTNMVVSINLFS